jgi:diguanylate cyclase (GGDEF)-like protein/PAS domain S-box-containing protein
LPQALSVVGGVLGVERILVLEFEPGTPEAPCLTLRYQWTCAAVTPLDQTFLSGFTLDSPDTTEWLAPLRRGEHFFFTQQTTNATVAAILENLKLASILLMPIFVRGRFWGHLSLQCSDSSLIWSGVEIDILRLLADSIGSATERADRVKRHGQTANQLSLSNILLTAVIKSSPDGILVANNINKILTYNPRFLEMWDISPEVASAGIGEKLLLTKTMLLKNPEQYIANIRFQHAHPSEEARSETEFKDGRVLDERSTVLRHADGEYIGRIWFYHDVTEIKRAAQTVADSEQRLRAILDTTVDGLLVIDVDSRKFVLGNRALMNMLGYDLDEFLKLNPDDIHPVEALAETRRIFASLAKGEINVVPDVSVRRRDGSVFYGDLGGALMQNAGKSFLVCNLHDITARKVAEQKVLQLARTDALTDLPNRRVFVGALQQAVARAGRGEKGFAILYFDLDYFKDVNDTLGHGVGDELLVAVAKRLRSSVRIGDVIARLGGDEFAILQTNIQDPSDAALLATKLLDVLAQPFSIGGNDIQSGTSIGITVSDADTTSGDVLLSHADLALYAAKSAGRGTYRFFAEAMDTEVHARVSLVSELRLALADGQMTLYYQPQVDARNGQIRGLEALVRWNHPMRGLLLPGSFIGIAELTGMIVPLGHWVQIEACRQMREWLDAGIAPPILAINVSAPEFKIAAINHQILSVIEKYRLPPDRIEVEITESTIMEASERSDDVLARLRQRGIRISIDDFGTGYSSLAYMKRFRPNRIKIAREFVSDMLENDADRAVVQAIIGIAHALSIDLIAEGVETAAQAKFLCDLGCCDVQGFAFSRPLPAADTTAILRRKKVFALLDSSVLSIVA